MTRLGPDLQKICGDFGKEKTQRVCLIRRSFLRSEKPWNPGGTEYEKIHILAESLVAQIVYLCSLEVR